MDFLKFGPVNPVSGYGTCPVPMYASEVIKAQSGRFCYVSSGYMRIAGDGTNKLFGFLESGDLTCQATNGLDIVNCIVDPSVIFRVPFRYDDSTYSTNYSIALIGTAVDLVVVSNVQYAILTTSDDDLLIVLGGEAATSSTSNDGWIICQMNTNEMHV